MRGPSGRTAIALALTALTIGAVAVPGVAARGVPGTTPSLPGPSLGGVHPMGAVTLVTGDRVTVRRVGQRLLPEMARGPGRAWAA
jgi:hypothetical protein